jgi:F-type H+/Na+-transporting ATPase subunit alpha
MCVYLQMTWSVLSACSNAVIDVQPFKSSTMPINQFTKTINSTFELLDKVVQNYNPSFVPREVGAVISISAGIVKVSGLPGVGFEELLQFPGGVFGIAYNIDEDEIGVILLGEDALLNAGDEVVRTGRVMDIPVGDALIGRVISPLGEPMDGKSAITFTKRLAIERPAYAIMDRAAVFVPLQTGLKVKPPLLLMRF